MSRGDALARLRQALEDHGSRVTGNAAQCPTPAHEKGDRRASLSIDQGDSGALVNCHLGCKTIDLLAEIGLTTADLYDEPREHSNGHRPTVVAEYRYTDEHGQLLFVKERRVPKDFRIKRPDGRGGWMWGLGDTRRVLYNLPAVLAAVREHRTVWLVEGEADADRLTALGECATCNFDGATKDGQRPKWKPAYGDVLAGARVVIVADRDAAGYAHAAAARADLDGKAASVTVMQSATTRKGDDVSDHLAAGCSLADLVPETDTSDSDSYDCQKPDEALTSETDTSDTSDSVLLEGVKDGAYLNASVFPPIRWAVPGLIPEGLTILVGPPKAGKSWLVLDLLLAVASGGQALGHIKTGTPRQVLYLALEDGDRRMQDRCRALIGGDHAGQDDGGEAGAIPELFCYKTTIMPGVVLPTIKAWMGRYPDTALIVIDTLGKVMPPALTGESAYQRDYRVGAALKAQADATPGLAVAVLHHDRKAGADDFVDSVSGTHGLAGAADTVVVLCRNRQSENGLLKITGRDVPENEYAITVTGGMAWQLDGGDLAAAAVTARKREEAEAAKVLSLTTTAVLAFVGEHPDGVQAADLADKFGKNVYQYLGRLTKAGRISKNGRGLYLPVTPSEVSEVSENQVKGAPESDTGRLSLSEVSETGEEDGDGEDRPRSMITGLPMTYRPPNPIVVAEFEAAAEWEAAHPACPRHQTRWGAHPKCPDCQALAEGGR